MVTGQFFHGGTAYPETEMGGDDDDNHGRKFRFVSLGSLDGLQQRNQLGSSFKKEKVR